MKCSTCGAENEPGNRFCEQCGARLEPSGVQPVQIDTASAPAGNATCPSCGATVVPGEAFCDNCGATLSVPAPAAAADAPTMIAAPAPSASSASSAGANGQGVTCPSCGHQNLPGDAFCDNCGAALTGAGVPQAEPAQSQPASDVPVLPPEPSQAAMAEAPTAEHPMVPDTSKQSQADYDSERKRLEDEIARQDQIIAQFEQMQQMFGAAAPPAVTQGLADARDARARAEADLNGLQPPAPAVDPAEVKRLEDEIARQDQIIAQFEQMQQMFGAAAPPAVTQGLADARDARAKAQSELDALQGGASGVSTSAPTSTSAPATADTTAPSSAQADAAKVEADLGQLGTTPAPSAMTPETAVSPGVPDAVPPPIEAPPASTPATTGPRLIMDDGTELKLPTDKAEIIVGREDPISGIFPEVDLTPFGGETGGVSRQHARISNAGGQWSLTDLNSTNYTRVDGTRIDPSVPVPINNGARLQFGRVAMTFQA